MEPDRDGLKLAKGDRIYRLNPASIRNKIAQFGIKEIQEEEG